MIKRVVGSSAAAVASARLYSLVAAAVQLPLLTRLLDPSDFGFVAIAIAVATYFSLVSAEATTLSFQRYPGSNVDRQSYRFTLIRVAIYVAVLSLVLCLIGLVTGNLVFLMAVAGWGTGIAANRLFSTAWLMWHEPWRYSGNLIATTTVRTALLLLLVAVGAEPGVAVALAGLATALVAFALAPRMGKRSDGWGVPWVWSFSVNLALASAAVTVLTNGVLLIVPLFVSANELGRFAATYQVVAYTSAAFISLLITVSYPAFRRDWDSGEDGQVRESMNVLLNAVLAIAAGGLLILSAGGHVLLGVIVGPKFAYPEVLPALIFGSAFLSMGLICSWLRQFQVCAGQVNLRSWAAAAVGVVLVALGTLWLGTLGAAIFSAAASFLYFVLQASGTSLARIPRLYAALLLGVAAAAAFLPLALWNVAVPSAAALVVVFPASVVLRRYLRRRSARARD